MDILIFEDDFYKRMIPLALTRHLSDIYISGLTNLERIKIILDHMKLGDYNIWLSGREYLSEYITHDLHVSYLSELLNLSSKHVIGINSLVLCTMNDLRLLIEKILQIKNTVWVKNGRIVAFNISKETLERICESTNVANIIVDEKFLFNLKESGVNISNVDVEVLSNPWDIIKILDAILKDDIMFFYNLYKEDYREVKRNVFIHKDAILGDVVILNSGPILIEGGAVVNDLVIITGPAWIKKDAKLLSNAKISCGVIGVVSKFGAEMDTAILDNYSNMAHVGFLGHSYVGRWVNIGALTAFSDLKNTYGAVKMSVNGLLTDSGMIKLGSFVSDFSKLSIGTYIYSGKWIGVSSLIHGLVNMDIPSFTIWTGKSLIELDVSKAIDMQKRMFLRRGICQKQYHAKLLSKIFELTKEERTKLNALKKKVEWSDFV